MADRGRVFPARRSSKPKRKPKPNPRKALKATALTVGNVCTALKPLEGRVMENNGLADYLRIPDEIKGDITKRHRKSNHLRKVVSYYLTRCPSPSWRGIILAVEWMGAHDVADSIRERVEPVRDPTLNPSNMIAVLHTVQDLKKLGFRVLHLPQCVCESIMDESSFTRDDKMSALVTHYLLYYPKASWDHLAGGLYRIEEDTALQAVRKYISQITEPNLTLHNLISTLEGLAESRNWWDLAREINLPSSKRKHIEKQFKSKNLCKEESLKEFLMSHPVPSWYLVSDAIYIMGWRMNNPAYHTALERVASMCPTAGASDLKPESDSIQIDISDISPAPVAKAVSKRKSLPDDMSTQPEKGHLLIVDDELLAHSKRRKDNDDITQASSASPHTSPLPAALSGARPTISSAAPSAGRSLDSAPTLRDLMNEVAAPAPAKRWDVAIGLGLEMEDVDRIKVESHGNCNEAYSAIFDKWRNKQSIPYTWRSVLKCLRSCSVDEQKIAGQIMKKCKQN